MILAEWVTLTQGPAHSKTNETTDGQSTDEAETRNGSSNIDVFPPALQPRIMFKRRGGDHAKCRDIPARPPKGKEDQHEHPIGGEDRLVHVRR